MCVAEAPGMTEINGVWRWLAPSSASLVSFADDLASADEVDPQRKIPEHPVAADADSSRRKRRDAQAAVVGDDVSAAGSDAPTFQLVEPCSRIWTPTSLLLRSIVPVIVPMKFDLRSSGGDGQGLHSEVVVE
jgi:hypothetical protein